MNYLAHLYLAGSQPGMVVGGFLADFVKGPLCGKYPHDIEAGMRLHRRIDSWSDQHPHIQSLKQILPDPFYRYTGIVADVLCDHALSCYWTDHTGQSLEDFSREKLNTLHASKFLYPERAQRVLARMHSGNWLTNYHNLDYCLSALTYIGQRLKRANPLHELEQPVKQNYRQISHLCLDIIGDLRINAAEWLSNQQ